MLDSNHTRPSVGLRASVLRRVLLGALCVGGSVVVACSPDDDLTRRFPGLSGYQVGGSTGGGYQVGGSTGGGYQVGGSTGGGYQVGGSRGGGYQVGGSSAPAGGGGGGGNASCEAVCAKVASCGSAPENCVAACPANSTEAQRQCVIAADGCAGIAPCFVTPTDGGTQQDGGTPRDGGRPRDGGGGSTEATCEEICTVFVECGQAETVEACLGSCNSSVTSAQKRCAKEAGSNCSALNACFAS